MHTCCTQKFVYHNATILQDVMRCSSDLKPLLLLFRVNLFSLFHSFCFKTFFEKVLVVQNVNEHKSFPWTVFKVTAVDTDDY